jgi:hypothetical protein
MPVEPHTPLLTRDAERASIIERFGHERFDVIQGLMERQLDVLMSRAQLLLGLCGIAITTTGFSGRIIAGNSRCGQTLIVAGLALVLASAAILVWGVLHLTWITQRNSQSLDIWLTSVLEYRDRKTALFRLAIILLLIGLALYVGAIAVMLLNPQPLVPLGR